MRGPQPDEVLDDGDNSTIASEFADNIDDNDVYLRCRQDKGVNDTLFSGPLFAELAIKEKQDASSPILNCPPEVLLPHVHVGLDDTGDMSMSDMDSVNDNNRNRKPIASRRNR